MASCSIARRYSWVSWHIVSMAAICVSLFCCASCMGPQGHRKAADKAAYDIIKEGQKAAGVDEPFSIERPSDVLRRRLLSGQDLLMSSKASLGSDELDPIKLWPETGEPNAVGSSDARIEVVKDAPVTLSLMDALEVGARNSFEYQDQKEEVFGAALNLDMARHDFASQFNSELSALGSRDRSSDDTVKGAEYDATIGWRKQLENGAQLSSNFAVGLAQLLTGDHVSSVGLEADASVKIPLLRGAGAHIAREPLTQAERDVLYAVWRFEAYKQSFAVDVASAYLGVLQQLNQVRNAEENYKGLIASTRRIRRQVEAGRVQQIQVDQAEQDELTARNRWVSAQQTYLSRLDSLKMMLGLPTDADIVLDREELMKLAMQYKDTILESDEVADANAPVPPADAPIELRAAGTTKAGRLEIEPERAIRTAFDRRHDLLVATGQVYDSQRAVVVAADRLRAEFTLLGTASAGEGRSIGSADEPDAKLRLGEDRVRYQALLTLDLPLDRQLERDNFRISLINFEQSVRAIQSLEDRIKQEIRGRLRDLLDARESVQIQAKAVKLAEKRVYSTDLFLQAGRAEVRDVLDAQEALLSAQNALTAAVVGYRVAELELQRDMGVLTVDEKGLWQEYRPGVADVTEQ